MLGLDSTDGGCGLGLRDRERGGLWWSMVAVGALA